MEINIVNLKGEELELSIKNEDISILYILQHELLNDKDVKFAGFALKHPLTLEYNFKIIASEPLDALLSAINKALSNTNELESIIRAKVGSI